MKMLIVGKTRMYRGCCIGALSLEDSQSLRLLEKDRTNPPRTTPYEIGQIWEISFESVTDLQPPHTEDIRVTERRYVDTIQDLKKILDMVEPFRGEINGLYQGLIKFQHNGKGYINALGVPSYSTWFWIPDRDLIKHIEEERARYYYNYKSLAYVGFAQPMDVIPARTLVRVSLARWWAPEDVAIEKRCYLQLSGWYL